MNNTYIHNGGEFSHNTPAIATPGAMEESSLGARSAGRPVKYPYTGGPFVESDDEDFMSSQATGVILHGEDRPTGAKQPAIESDNQRSETTKTTAVKASSGGSRLSHSIGAPWTNVNSFSGTSTSPAAPSRYPDLDPDSLFIPEIEDNLNLLRGSTRRYSLTMDALVRARAIKGEIENNISVLQPQDKKTSVRRHTEDDPENQLITSLRQSQQMSWGEIAARLNQERRDRQEPADFTEQKVYARFVQNVPRLATAVNEIGFDPKDYMHLRQPAQSSSSNGRASISNAGKKRVKNYDNATELKANVRPWVAEEEQAELETAERSEQLMEAVAKVERNFWTMVADEMERATTRLYQPDALASRYHAI